jgi:hypothetical protein
MERHIYTYRQKVTLKIRLHNGKVVGLNTPGKKHTEKLVDCVHLKSDMLYFVNIFSANKVTILCSVDLLH